MERKYKVNDSAAGDSSAHGAQSKEVALDKLRKMEWKRNQQDPWHLARSHPRAIVVQEKKKYNKDEDNYFDGTGVQKTKKLRRPRTSEGPPSVPPGFSVNDSSSPAPPQVNAWAQKKGSALFQRDSEIDEEDQVMKLVIEESLRSAEEDKRRRMERMKMTNLDLPTSSKMCAEKDWEEEFTKEDFHENLYLDDGVQEDPETSELQFVDTDVQEETPTANQRHRSIPPRARKLSPREKSSPPTSNQKYDFPSSSNKVPPTAVNNNARVSRNIRASSRVLNNDLNNDDFFEPSRPQEKPSKSVDKANESTTNPLYVKTSNNSEDLATRFNTTLTFGDTQGLLESINDHELKGNTQDFRNEAPSYLVSADNSSGKKPADPSVPSETDILVHSFIRHDPPSDTNSLFTMPASPTYTPQNPNMVQGYGHQMINTEQHSLVNGLAGSTLPGGVPLSNGQDSSSSMSGSPLQNITPFGSLEKEIPYIGRTGLQATSHIGNLPYQYPYSVENQDSLTRQLQAMQLMNQNLPSATNTDYSSVPSQVRGLMQANPQPQFRLPNSNIIFPPFQGHMSPLLLQHQLQQAQLQQVPAQFPPGYLSQLMALDAARLQQSQLMTGVAESDNKATDEQGNTGQLQNSNHLLAQNQANLLTQMSQTQPPQNDIPSQSHLLQAHPQILAQAQAQLLSQSQPHLIHLQNHPQMPLQNHPQMPLQNHPQMPLQNHPQMPLQNPPQMPLQNHPQMPLQNHPQMPLQNPPQMPLQNPPQSIPQTIPQVETSTPKQEELLQQQALMGGRAEPAAKTSEGLSEDIMEYLNAYQNWKRAVEKLQEAQIQPPLPQMAQQPPWGIVAPSPGLPLAGNQFFPVGIMPQVHPQLVQQPLNTGLTSPSIQQPQNLPGSMNIGQEMQLGSELNRGQEPTMTSVGRGRGRLH